MDPNIGPLIRSSTPPAFSDRYGLAPLGNRLVGFFRNPQGVVTVQGIHARRAILPKRLHKITNTIGDGLALPLLGVIWHCVNRHPRRVGLAPEMHDGRVADLINYEGARTAVYLKALSPWKLRGERILG